MTRAEQTLQQGQQDQRHDEQQQPLVDGTPAASGKRCRGRPSKTHCYEVTITTDLLTSVLTAETPLAAYQAFLQAKPVYDKIKHSTDKQNSKDAVELMSEVRALPEMMQRAMEQLGTSPEDVSTRLVAVMQQLGMRMTHLR